jgi:hypothetical protein
VERLRVSHFCRLLVPTTLSPLALRHHAPPPHALIVSTNNPSANITPGMQMPQFISQRLTTSSPRYALGVVQALGHLAWFDHDRTGRQVNRAIGFAANRFAMVFCYLTLATGTFHLTTSLIFRS